MSGGGGTQQSSTTSGPPPQVLANYQQLVGTAYNQSQQPLNLYQGPYVAGFTPMQQAGFSQVSNTAGQAQPYLNAAAQYYGQMTQPLWQQLPQMDTSYLASAGQGALGGAYNTAANFGQYTDQQSAAAQQYAGGIYGNQQPYLGAQMGLASSVPGGLAGWQYGATGIGNQFNQQAQNYQGAISNAAYGIQGQLQPYQQAQAGAAMSAPGTVDPYQQAMAQTGYQLPGMVQGYQNMATGQNLTGAVSPYQNYSTSTANSTLGYLGQYQNAAMGQNLPGAVSPYQNAGYAAAQGLQGTVDPAVQQAMYANFMGQANPYLQYGQQGSAAIATAGQAGQNTAQQAANSVQGTLDPYQQAAFGAASGLQGAVSPWQNAAGGQDMAGQAALYQQQATQQALGLSGIVSPALQAGYGANYTGAISPYTGGMGAAAAGIPGAINPAMQQAYGANLGGVTDPYTQMLQQQAGGVMGSLSPYQNAAVNQNLPGMVQGYQGAAGDIAGSMAGNMAGYQSAMSGVANQMQQGVQPYQNTAMGFAQGMPGAVAGYQGAAAGAGAASPGAVAGYQQAGTNYQVDPYLSPYTKNVTDALSNLFNQQNAQQQSQIKGNAASSGALGGDRQAVAQALAIQQQNLSQAPTLANVLQSGYQQAQQEGNTQQQMALQAGQLGLSAQQQNIQAQLGAGQLGLGAQQAGLQGAIQAGQLGLGAQQAQGALYGQAGQAGLSAQQAALQGQLGAGQLGMSAGAQQAQNQLAAGQLGLSGYGQQAQMLSQAGQLGLQGYGQQAQLGLQAGQLGLQGAQGQAGIYGQAGQLGLGAAQGQTQAAMQAGQLGLGAGQDTLQGLLQSGQLGTTAQQAQAQAALGAGQLGLGAGQGALQGYLQGGQLGLSGLGQMGQLGLGAGQLGMNSQQAAVQQMLATGQFGQGALAQQIQSGLQGGQLGLQAGMGAMQGYGQMGQLGLGAGQAQQQAALQSGQLGLGGLQQQIQAYLQSGQLGLGAAQGQGQLALQAGQLGLGAGTAQGQLLGQAGQLGLGGLQQEISGLGQAGQLGLGGAQTMMGGLTQAGQLGVTAGQAAMQGQLGAGQLGLGGYQAALGAYGQAGQQNLAAQQAAMQGYLGAGQLNLGTGQGQMQGLLGAMQGGFGQFNTQQQQQLAADQANAWLSSQAGFGMANLAQEQQNLGLGMGQAMLGAGGLQQQLAQQQLNIPLQQYNAQQAYPWQMINMMAPIVEGTGSLSGGTGTTTSPGQSGLSQAAGIATAGVGVLGATGAFGDTGWLTNAFAKRGGRIGMGFGGAAPSFGGHDTVNDPVIPSLGAAMDSKPEVDTGVDYIDDVMPSGMPAPGGGASKSSLGLSANQPVVTKTQTTSGGDGGLGSALGLIGSIAKIGMMFAAKDGGRLPHYDTGGSDSDDTTGTSGIALPIIGSDITKPQTTLPTGTARVMSAGSPLGPLNHSPASNAVGGASYHSNAPQGPAPQQQPHTDPMAALPGALKEMFPKDKDQKPLSEPTGYSDLSNKQIKAVNKQGFFMRPDAVKPTATPAPMPSTLPAPAPMPSSLPAAPTPAPLSAPAAPDTSFNAASDLGGDYGGGEDYWRGGRLAVGGQPTETVAQQGATSSEGGAGSPGMSTVVVGGGSPMQQSLLQGEQQKNYEKLKEEEVQYSHDPNPFHAQQAKYTELAAAQKQHQPGGMTAQVPALQYQPQQASQPANTGLAQSIADLSPQTAANGGRQDGEPRPYVTEDELDPVPLVDHSGPTVVVRFRSEGKALDLGLPSIRDRRHLAAGGLPDPGMKPLPVPAATKASAQLSPMGAPDDLGHDPVTGVGTYKGPSGVDIPQIKAMNVQQLAATDPMSGKPYKPGEGGAGWYNPLPQPGKDPGGTFGGTAPAPAGDGGDGGGGSKKDTPSTDTPAGPTADQQIFMSLMGWGNDLSKLTPTQRGGLNTALGQTSGSGAPDAYYNTPEEFAAGWSAMGHAVGGRIGLGFGGAANDNSGRFGYSGGGELRRTIRPFRPPSAGIGFPQRGGALARHFEEGGDVDDTPDWAKAVLPKTADLADTKVAMNEPAPPPAPAEPETPPQTMETGLKEPPSPSLGTRVRHGLGLPTADDLHQKDDAAAPVPQQSEFDIMPPPHRPMQPTEEEKQGAASEVAARATPLESGASLTAGPPAHERSPYGYIPGTVDWFKELPGAIRSAQATPGPLMQPPPPTNAPVQPSTDEDKRRASEEVAARSGNLGLAPGASLTAAEPHKRSPYGYIPGTVDWWSELPGAIRSAMPTPGRLLPSPPPTEAPTKPVQPATDEDKRLAASEINARTDLGAQPPGPSLTAGPPPHQRSLSSYIPGMADWWAETPGAVRSAMPTPGRLLQSPTEAPKTATGEAQAPSGTSAEGLPPALPWTPKPASPPPSEAPAGPQGRSWQSYVPGSVDWFKALPGAVRSLVPSSEAAPSGPQLVPGDMSKAQPKPAGLPSPSRDLDQLHRGLLLRGDPNADAETVAAARSFGVGTSVLTPSKLEPDLTGQGPSGLPLPTRRPTEAEVEPAPVPERKPKDVPGPRPGPTEEAAPPAPGTRSWQSYIPGTVDWIRELPGAVGLGQQGVSSKPISIFGPTPDTTAPAARPPAAPAPAAKPQAPPVAPSGGAQAAPMPAPGARTPQAPPVAQPAPAAPVVPPAPGTAPAPAAPAQPQAPTVVGAGNMKVDAQVGRNPQTIYSYIAGKAKEDPNYWQGKKVLLSTGVANDPSQVAYVPKQIEALTGAGAQVVGIMGFTDHLDPKVSQQQIPQGVFDQVQGYADAAKIPFGNRFTGNLNPNYPVHLNKQGYADIGGYYGGKAGGVIAVGDSHAVLAQQNGGLGGTGDIKTVGSVGSARPGGQAGVQPVGAQGAGALGTAGGQAGGQAATAPPGDYKVGNFIKHFEGSSAHPYPDAGGTTAIAWGHTITPGERTNGINTSMGVIKFDHPLSAQEQDAVFEADYPKYEDTVRKAVPNYDQLGSNQKEALVSYAYNVGHLPNGIGQAIASGNMQSASDMLTHGVNTGKGIGFMQGLADRRAMEGQLFMLPDGQHLNLSLGAGGGHGSPTGTTVGGPSAGAAGGQGVGGPGTPTIDQVKEQTGIKTKSPAEHNWLNDHAWPLIMMGLAWASSRDPNAGIKALTAASPMLTAVDKEQAQREIAENKNATAQDRLKMQGDKNAADAANKATVQDLKERQFANLQSQTTELNALKAAGLTQQAAIAQAKLDQSYIAMGYRNQEHFLNTVATMTRDAMAGNPNLTPQQAGAQATQRALATGAQAPGAALTGQQPPAAAPTDVPVPENIKGIAGLGRDGPDKFYDPNTGTHYDRNGQVIR